MQTQPPVRPISREQQLQLENEMLRSQLQQLVNNRASSSKYALGEIADGIAFTLQAANGPDEDAAQGAKAALETLRLLLEQVLKGEWKLPGQGSRILIPR